MEPAAALNSSVVRARSALHLSFAIVLLSFDPVGSAGLSNVVLEFERKIRVSLFVRASALVVGSVLKGLCCVTVGGSGGLPCAQMLKRPYDAVDSSVGPRHDNESSVIDVGRCDVDNDYDAATTNAFENIRRMLARNKYERLPIPENTTTYDFIKTVNEFSMSFYFCSSIMRLPNRKYL